MAVNGVQRYMQVATKAQFPKSAKTDPVNNNLPNSSKDGNYPYNPAQKQATEPITTSSSGKLSSEPVSSLSIGSAPKNVERLQAALANRQTPQTGENPPETSSQTTTVNVDSNNQTDGMVLVQRTDPNTGNIYVAQDLLGFTTPMDAEERIKLVEDYEKRQFNRDALFQGVTQLGAALGGGAGKFSTVFGSVS